MLGFQKIQEPTWPEQTSPKANELTEQGYHETTTPSVAAVSVNASTISTEVLVKYQRQDKENMNQRLVKLIMIMVRRQQQMKLKFS